jgi:hypothetical protein
VSKVEFGLEETYLEQKQLDMCIGYLGTYHDQLMYKVDSRSKGNTIVVDCAPVERTRWRTMADSSGYGHENGRD